MNNYMKQLHHFAPVVLRLGIAGVIIWFGTSQLLDQSAWTSFIPDWAISITHLSAKVLVLFNGLFEIVTGILLAYGLFVRPIASLLFLHMCSIVMTVGLSPIGVRDIGVASGLLSIALYGYDILSWHYSPDQTYSADTTQ